MFGIFVAVGIFVLAHCCAPSYEAAATPAPRIEIATDSSNGVAQTRLVTSIGMEGTYYLRYAGKTLEAKAFEENTPLLVRIAQVTPADGDGKARLYELRYVGTRAGRFDLRDYLVAVDGGATTDVPPIAVEFKELLPTDYAGGLEELGPVEHRRAWPYRTIMLVACGAWLLPVAWVFGKRVFRRRPAAPPTPVGPMSTEAELQALVGTALAGGLDIPAQARLEELLHLYWRDCLAARKVPTIELRSRMAEDARTGELVRQLEAWLYRPPGDASVDLAKLLAPYRDVAKNGRSPAAAGASVAP